MAGQSPERRCSMSPIGEVHGGSLQQGESLLNFEMSLSSRYLPEIMMATTVAAFIADLELPQLIQRGGGPHSKGRNLQLKYLRLGFKQELDQR